jgi:hypothetical protein
VGSLSVFGLAVGGVMYFHRYAYGELLMLASVTLVIATMAV